MIIPPEPRITRITFPCRYWHDGAHAKKVAEFTLGNGPCGKDVAKLDMEDVNGLFRITQWHGDGSYKVFIYRRQDVLGRIELGYEVWPAVAQSTRCLKHAWGYSEFNGGFVCGNCGILG